MYSISCKVMYNLLSLCVQCILCCTAVTIGFENETYPSDEGQGSVEVCARVIDGGLQRDVEVTLVTQDGSAVGMLEKDKCVQLRVHHKFPAFFSLPHEVSADYQQVSVVLTFGEASERSCVQIELVNDTIFEGPEDLTVVLSTVETVVTLAPDTARVTLQDDDGRCECKKLNTVLLLYNTDI